MLKGAAARTEQSSGRLPVVRFAKSPGLDALDLALESLGFEVEIRDGAEWLTEPAPGEAGLRVVYFDAQTSESTTRDVLAHLSVPSTLFVHRGASPLEFEAVAASFASRPGVDLVQWPCHEYELSFRLERLRLRLQKADPDPDASSAERLARLGIIGRSARLDRMLHTIERFADSDAPALIEGPTGSGKELAARALHALSPRLRGPFEVLNCGALPDTLVESELFGHERGAFTDARQMRRGAVELAEGGTLFLDEVNALSQKAQAALLRFLETSEFRRLGGQETRNVDIRVVAASNQSLEALCQRGDFRSDLRFRLDVLRIEVPPLCERPDDIEPLAEHFLDELRERYGPRIEGLSASGLRALCAHDWPGNVRELKSVLHRGFLLCDAQHLDERHLGLSPSEIEPAPAEVATDLPFAAAKARAIAAFEQSYLRALMADAGGNVTLAARRSQKERRALGKLLKRYGLDRREFE